MHCRWYPSIPCSRGVCYPSMHCRWYPSMPCSGGCYPSMPCRRGSAPRGLRVCARGVPGRDPPDGYCCGRYASCWNAFLFCMISVYSIDAGLLGLALAYALNMMGLFQCSVRQSAEVEKSSKPLRINSRTESPTREAYF